MSLFNREITKDQSRDAGMALVLLLLLVFLGRKREGWLIAAMAVHVLNMAVPQIYRPFAFVWFGLSDVIGAVTSKILLAIVFFTIVAPIGIIRRLSGKDALKLRAFKAGQDSAMVDRNHAFVGADLEKPY